MKKKLTAIFLCVALAAIAIVGASLAYFTDTKSATNTFTVGNVKIDLIESRYHRQGSGGTGDTSIPAPSQTASGMKYVKDGVKAFTDDEIKKDAETYKTDYLDVKGQNMVPGRRVAKSPYVINTGANDAYIRIRVMIPSAANNDFVAVKDGGVITNQWCSSSFNTGEFIDQKGGGWNNAPAIDKASVTKDGVTYDVYTFTRTEPLKAGAITAKDGTMTLNVLVEADAIQAEGFADAAAAWAAFK